VAHSRIGRPGASTAQNLRGVSDSPSKWKITIANDVKVKLLEHMPMPSSNSTLLRGGAKLACSVSLRLAGP